MTESERKKERSNIRVLVLDDEEPIRNLIGNLLTRQGFLVETADDGRTGLQILLQRDFDVAVVDLHMRDMGGSAFLQEASSIWPWLGIVVFSGHVDDDTRAHALRHGVTRVLQKPLDLNALLENVLAEAREKKQLVEMSSTHSLDNIQGQLAVLRRFSEQAIAAESLDQAVSTLSAGLGTLLPPCHAVAVLNLQADEQALHLNPVRPVSQEFVLALEREVLQRYEALSGKTRPRESLRIIFDPSTCDEKGPRTVGSSFSIPIITEGEVKGLLALGAAEPDAFSTLHAAFLYHAANQLATILAALARMRQLSVRDTLTGLFNRKGLQEEFQRIWMMGRRYRWAVGVAVIDIDQFKTLNDTHGHLRGDEILREFSKLVEKVARESDIVGRYGGDEVVVVLPQAGSADCIAFGERLLYALRHHMFCQESLGGLALTASVGVATSLSSPTESSEQLLALADQALYVAKNQGRNRVCIYQAEAVTTVATGNSAAASLSEGAAEGGGRSRARILIVDDEPAVGALLSRVLRKSGYQIQVETGAEEALQAVRAAPGEFDLLLTDLNLPGLSGLELLDKLRSVDESMIKIVITGQATLDNAITSLRRGAYDFIEKPVSPDQLTAVTERALEYRFLKKENARYQNHLEDMVREKSAALRQALEQVRDSYDFTLETMANLLDAREKSTAHHCTRVRNLSVVVARELGLSQSEIEDLARGALLHDIGKIAIPDAILLKPGPLSEEEMAIMKTHAEVGYRLLKSSNYLEHVAELVYSHHEHFDGSGYPRGLQGEDIMLGARIFTLIDAYDAMRSDRVYRKALPSDAALAEIKRHAGSQFDPRVVEAVIRCHAQLEATGNWSG